MSTTSVFVEPLLAGMQASVWMVLLLISFFGYEWIAKVVPKLENWASLATIVLLAFWYTAGIIIDQFAIGFIRLLGLKRLGLRSQWVSRWIASGALQKFLGYT